MNRKLKVIIWGATGQAIVLEELLTSYKIEIDAFFENNKEVISPINYIPIYYGESGFKEWSESKKNLKNYQFLVAIGGSKGEARENISRMLKNNGLLPYTAIHKTAYVASNAVIGEGVQLLANSTICAKASIGDNCIVNTSASVDHECIIENNVHIGPGAKLAGCIKVEKNVFIGVNATVLPKIKIGSNSIVGAGAVVTKDVPQNCIVIGNPAHLYKKII